jgi:hypothetical protein
MSDKNIASHTTAVDGVSFHYQGPALTDAVVKFL